MSVYYFEICVFRIISKRDKLCHLCEWQSYLYQRISCSLIAKSDARFVFERLKVELALKKKFRAMLK